MKILNFQAALLVVLALAGCALSPSPADRRAAAEEIAQKAQLQEKIIPGDTFDILSWQRIAAPGQPADVYIEGDGSAWQSRTQRSADPTPRNPLALKLAAADPAANVVYLARPCQFGQLQNCTDADWTDGRTAPAVIKTYRDIFDRLHTRDHIGQLHLIGYSGGASVAVLAAAGRTDILSIRTVAGNLDYRTFNAAHGTDPMTGSVDPLSAAPLLAHVPQRHFIGGNDDIVPPEIFKGWEKASGGSACIAHDIIPDARHDSDWAAAWPRLLREALPPCEKP